MAKRKSSTPKSRRNSSFAARTATKVIDSTSNDAKHKEAENLNEPSTEIAQVSNNKTANPSISKDTIKKKRINCLEEIKMLQRTTSFCTKHLNRVSMIISELVGLESMPFSATFCLSALELEDCWPFQNKLKPLGNFRHFTGFHIQVCLLSDWCNVFRPLVCSSALVKIFDNFGRFILTFFEACFQPFRRILSRIVGFVGFVRFRPESVNGSNGFN